MNNSPVTASGIRNPRPNHKAHIAMAATTSVRNQTGSKELFVLSFIEGVPTLLLSSDQ